MARSSCTNSVQLRLIVDSGRSAAGCSGSGIVIRRAYSRPPPSPTASAEQSRGVGACSVAATAGDYGEHIERPPYSTSFVGRRSLLADVREPLGSSRIVTLVGPGGVGKTRVAVRLGDGEGRSYRDGCWLVALDAVADPQLLGPAVAEALGLQG